MNLRAVIEMIFIKSGYPDVSTLYDKISPTDPNFLKVANILFLLNEFYGYRFENLERQLHFYQDDSHTFFIDLETLREDFCDRNKEIECSLISPEADITRMEAIIDALAQSYLENLRMFVNYVVFMNSIVINVAELFRVEIADTKDVIDSFISLK